MNVVAMRTASWVIGVLALLCVATAGAQNILDNPYFDDGLNNWEPLAPERVMWTNTLDYHDDDSLRIGSAELDSHEGMAVLAQCVPVDDQVYVATAWVNSSCAGQTLDVFWADDGCIASDANISARSTVTDAWQPITAVGAPAAGSTHAVVTLVNPGACGTSAFFDVVSMQTDDIFADNFEIAL
jgi:hypothetical protein